MTQDGVSQRHASPQPIWNPRGNRVHVPKAAELIAAEIRSLIAQRTLKDGDALPGEPEMMVYFGVSRPTLREAVRILEAESLVSIRRGERGTIRLPDLTASSTNIGLLLQLRGTTLVDVFEARVVIEPPLMARLAEHRTDADITAIREHLDHEAAVIQDLEAFALATAQLHKILVERSGNQTLCAFIGIIEEIFQKHVTESVRRQASRFDYAALNKQALRNHEHLLTLITARQARSAESWWKSHMESVREVIFAEYEETSVLDLYGRDAPARRSPLS